MLGICFVPECIIYHCNSKFNIVCQAIDTSKAK